MFALNKKLKDEKVRINFTFFGIVQGVGFRYTAYHLANSLGLTGFVMNNEDGSVTMQIQGLESTIQKCLNGLERSPYIQIDKVSKNLLPLNPQDRRFYILSK